MPDGLVVLCRSQERMFAPAKERDTTLSERGGRETPDVRQPRDWST